ncbi:hypothetical protein Pse7429DRAFT_3020 [Pseudanabaena biceps PCC 7429]|uniref:Uncharacterized protein n=1 Tax=Pseudanabaena biceps PCC 7429 TaxID=927668 RepID=L8MWU9_9CYAN|nr:hypothetical protein Pse7429DRAFT_3020 [Pseudanabaena biceps PCC 7429]
MTGFSAAILLIKYTNLLTPTPLEVGNRLLNTFLRFVIECIYLINTAQKFTQ